MTMPAYAVFEPPIRQRDHHDRADRFVFLREGFSMAAFLFGPLWMITRRLWFSFIIYAAVVAALEFGLPRLGIAWPVRLSVYVLIQLLIGIEAASLRRAGLLRRGFREFGIVIADDLDLAERRFFDVRATRQRAATNPLAPSPAAAQLPPAPGVVGLFPEPGGGL
jgi:hypothetical protein